MDDGKSDVLQQFCAITGVDDVAAAMNVLEATNWELEDAINLQFATGGDLGGAGAGGGAGSAAGGAGGLPPLEEEEVRAPMPVMRDRLFGDGGMHGIPAGGGGIARYGAPPPPDRGPSHIDVFQDFKPPVGDPQTAGAAAAGAAAQAPAAAGASGGPPKGPNLSQLFKPPAGLMFEGDFDAAKGKAADKGLWLLVNVQTADEFASHMLNRDTWGNELIQDMVRESFVIWQVYNTSEVGAALKMQYHLQDLPATFIVDPITGAMLWQRTGFISPDTLIEEFVPFLDVGPNHPDAHKLAQRFHAQAAKRRHQSSASGAAAAVHDNMTEDDQLAMALAMSVEGQGGGSNAMRESLDDLDEQAIWQEIMKRQKQEDAAAAAGTSSQAAATQPPAAPPAAAAEAAPPAAAAVQHDVDAVQAAAAARLPPEPASGGCRVAFRLPDGARVQRNFSSSDTVAVLQDYVVSVSKEAAAMPSIVLSEARPGAAALDPSATIEAAGVAGAMLVCKST